MNDARYLKIGCFTPVRRRELYLRTCLMQMALQTRLPDTHLILLNGEEADGYDRRVIDDLLEPWVSIVTVARTMTTREVYTLALEKLLEGDTQIFVKIDSDDLYRRNYLEVIIDQINELQLHQRAEGFCINLVNQLWVDAQSDGSATIKPHGFRRGLGLSPEEEARGIRVGAPPTYVFDRKAAEFLVAGTRRPPYLKERYEDRAWRNILLDHGIQIELIDTARPVFGYLRHGGNTCTLKPRQPSSTAEGK